MIDMIGKRFGRLVTIEKSERRGPKGEIFWVCLCDCGTRVVVNGCRMRNGYTRSCGCLRADVKKTHEMTGSRIYSSWNHMRDRCNNPNGHAYDRYGGRGITVCSSWDSFETFLFDMGERPIGMSLGRIKNEKGYAPNNCRWETPKQQANNRRKQRKNRRKQNVGV